MKSPAENVRPMWKDPIKVGLHFVCAVKASTTESIELRRKKKKQD